MQYGVAVIDLQCIMCRTTVELPDDAEILPCLACGRDFAFLECSHCGSIEQVEIPQRWSSWTCSFCWRSNSSTDALRFGPARERAAELGERGLLPLTAESRLLGGFTFVGGSGFAIEPEAVCSVATRPGELLIAVEIGESFEQRVPFRNLTELRVDGGTITSGGGFIGGGFGLSGAVEGMLIASVLNHLTTKTSTHTILHVGSTTGELLLHHGKLQPDTIRTTLSPMFVGLAAARHRSQPPAEENPLTQLERLGKLKDSGLLTDAEFEAARASYVKQITDGARTR
ncbi:MAG: SHOCT domain-containing protein [Solirubrobacteraceae bacterium]